MNISNEENKEKRKRDQCRKSISKPRSLLRSEVAGGFTQLTESCTKRNPRQLSHELRQNLSNLESLRFVADCVWDIASFIEWFVWRRNEEMKKWETLQCLLLWSPVIRVRRMSFLINDYCLLISRILYPYIFARARPLASLFASFSFCSGLCLGIWKSFRDFVRFGKQFRNWLFPSEVLCFSIQVFARIDSPVHLLHFYYEFVLYSFHEAYEYTNIGSLSRESSSTLGLSLLRICFALWTTKRRWHRLLWICGCLDVWACSSARWRNGEWVSLNYGMQVGWNVV